MAIRNINSAFGDPIIFDTVEEMVEALDELGYMPEDGIVEGVDYEEIFDGYVEGVDY